MSEGGRVLIIEDDAGLQKQMRWCLADRWTVEVAANATEAEASVRRFVPDVITLDLGLPPDPGGYAEGFRLLEMLRDLAPKAKVIVITGREDSEHAVRAIALGAFDFYQKPVDSDTLQFVVERALRIGHLELENERLRNVEASGSPIDGIVGNCEAMLRLCRRVEKIAPTDVSTLVLGETGTGKEIIASALHNLSARSDGPFVAINCAAIPENLLESELFGYEKGAFTGASAQKKGKIELAHGGTLFLDEIGDMPLPLQAKLLRFLQERSVERLGSTRSIPVDVRIVSATHRDLQSRIAEESFREDLFYRLAEITLEIPALRDREGDALLIARALLRRFEGELRLDRHEFSDSAARAIATWTWPGNVREMENRIKRAVLLADERVITCTDLDLDEPGDEGRVETLREARERAEAEAIRRALAITGGNVSQTAKLLGVTRPTLYSIMQRAGIGAG